MAAPDFMAGLCGVRLTRKLSSVVSSTNAEGSLTKSGSSQGTVGMEQDWFLMGPKKISWSSMIVPIAGPEKVRPAGPMPPL